MGAVEGMFAMIIAMFGVQYVIIFMLFYRVLKREDNLKKFMEDITSHITVETQMEEIGGDEDGDSSTQDEADHTSGNK